MNSLTEHVRAWLILELHTSMEPLFDKGINLDIYTDFILNKPSEFKIILEKCRHKYKINDKQYKELELDIKILQKLYQYYNQDNTLSTEKGESSYPYYIFSVHYLKKLYNIEPTNLCVFLIQAYNSLDYKFSGGIKMRKYLLDLIERKKYSTLEEYVDIFAINKELNGSHLSTIYELKRRLGIGTYKKVYLGRNIISDTLKAISIFDISERGKVNMEKKGLSLLDMIKNETKRAEDLKNIGNPHIARIDEVSYNEKSKNYILITELMEKTLQEELEEKEGRLPEKQVLRYLPQIVDGLDTMHKKGVIHSDITLSNIGLKEDTLKLMDFGLTSTILGFNEKKTNTGSIDTRAPELFEGKKVTTQSDMWSLGCILYKLLMGEYPFLPDMKKPKEPGADREAYEKEVYDLIKSKDISETLKTLKASKQTKAIIEKCLEINPKERVKNASELKAMLNVQ